MISIRRISLGGGYRYLMESVAVGDGATERTNSLARYYAESGTPPGVFLGAGLSGLNGDEGVEPGSTVTEEHLRNMLAACCDPVTGEPVGATPRAPRGGTPVAGFDLTFSPPKSVSTAWALGDEGTKAVIFDCHRRAVEFVIAYAENEVFKSRSGTNGIVEEDVVGVVATAFTHWDSRAGDPQLHDHVVVWNRAQSTSDGKWRTIDSRGLYKSVTALSKMHQGVLSDYLTEALGVGWDSRNRRHSDRPRWEITGVPETLMKEFSQRVEQVEGRTDTLIDEFVDARGRRPSGVELHYLRKRATVETRPAKTHRSLADMTDGWRERAESHLGPLGLQVAWVTSLKDRNDLPLLRAGDLDDVMLANAADVVLGDLAERHATFTRQQLRGEAACVVEGVRFASPAERVAVMHRISDLAIERSLVLTAPRPGHTPGRYRRPDRSSRLAPESRKIYTTELLLEAEARLLDAGRRLHGPVVPVGTVARVTDTDLPGRDYALSVDQALAVEKVATSGRWLDVLVGPAGTGKSTAMAGLRAVWEANHGPGSVVGLAPSAGTADVLADELGIDTENTAKWLTEHRKLLTRIATRNRLATQLHTHPPTLPGAAERLKDRLRAVEVEIDRWQLRPGQLVIVDEASLAGTFALDELVGAAGDAGAKVLLVGDWAQLSAVDAGGGFGLLARDQGDLAPELTDVRRFQAPWEKVASVELRLGHEAAVDSYQAHARIVGGPRDELLDAIYTAWRADIEAARSSLMIAGDAATVAELNRRARTGRVAAGQVSEAGLALAAAQTAGVGDDVVTRHNNRRLAVGNRWVKNGDRWVVTATNEDGSMAVRRPRGGGEVVLPADYVAEHVELAYATTAHRAQGRTVDSAHAMVSPTTTREVLYVAATRGRASNRLYVDVAYEPDPQTGHDGMVKPQTIRDVLTGVLANEGADISAHETRRRSQHEAESWPGLHAEYQTLAQAAQADRWDALLERSGLSDEHLQQVRASEALGPLVAAFQDAEARGLDIETVFPQLVGARCLSSAADPASVLHGRVDRWVEAAGSQRRVAGNLIAGLVPRALGITDPDMAHALAERDQAMEHRARHLAEQALDSRAVWARRLGPPPITAAFREQWLRAVSTVAAYRERWGIDHDNRPLGPQSNVTTIEHVGHRKRAQAALDRALALSRPAEDAASSMRAVPIINEMDGVGL